MPENDLPELPSPSVAAAMLGRVGGLTRWARATDRTAATALARAAADAALDQRLILELALDPLSPTFPAQLDAARRAHFARLALRSWESRRGASL